MIKAVKIRETFEDFLEEHPELEVKQNEKGIISIQFPEEATKTSYTIVLGEVMSLYYTYKGESIHFTS